MSFGTQWGSDEQVGVVSVAVAAGLLLLYFLVSVVASLLFRSTGFVQFDPAVGLVVPFSILFGVVGIAAATAGVVVRDLVHGAVGASTVVVALAHVLGGFLAYRLGLRIGVLTVGQGLRDWGRWFVGFGLLALSVAGATAAAIGLGYELLALAPFYLAFFTAVQYFLATVVLGVPLLVAVVRVVPEQRVQHLTTERPGMRRFVPLVVVVSLGWFVAGVVGSLGFRIAAEFPAAALHGAGLGFVVTLADPGLFGRGAVRLLILLTAVAVAVLVLLLVADRREAEVRR